MTPTIRDNGASVYELQHEVWPGWAEGDFGVRDDADALTRLLGEGRGRRILDLGCGSGRLSCAMARRGWHTLGVDVSSTLIARARKRAAQEEPASQPQFFVADLREYHSDSAFDVVILWDSVLAIWPWADAHELLLDVASRLLAPGGSLVIEQLNPSFFAKTPEFETVIDNPAIGPGRTNRSYRFDISTGCLRDDVSVTHSSENVVVLPTQTLHLVESDRIENALAEAGFCDLVTQGSDGWQWPNEKCEPDESAARFMLAGRGP